MSKKAPAAEPVQVGPKDASRTSQLANLKVGEYITDAYYLPVPVAAGEISKVRAQFNSLWASNISRAKSYIKGSVFKATTIVGISPDGDVAVTLIIQRTA